MSESNRSKINGSMVDLQDHVGVIFVGGQDGNFSVIIKFLVMYRSSIFMLLCIIIKISIDPTIIAKFISRIISVVDNCSFDKLTDLSEMYLPCRHSLQLKVNRLKVSPMYYNLLVRKLINSCVHQSGKSKVYNIIIFLVTNW